MIVLNLLTTNKFGGFSFGKMGVKMRKLFASLLLGIGLLFAGANINPAQSAQVANVEYIHLLIKQEWGIEVPYYPENAKLVANMEYLLMVVDRANLMLNGEETSSYASDPVYATKQAVDTIAVNQAVETLIKKIDLTPKFFVTTTSSTSSFSFRISAKGTYLIDWGDGNKETINKTNTTNTTYSHTYDSAGEYTIGIGGEATAYNTSTSTAAISFYNNKNTAGISGSLGAIFGTLADGTNPRFYQTFSYNTNLTGEIPADLFAGISGAPAGHMFYGTFSGCSKLSGSIPEGLFGNISGAPADFMFSSTFYGCSNLSGTIPENLFGNISGAPASRMFSYTFSKCSNLSGTIPENLFAGISSAPERQMFSGTFSGCSGLTGTIPENLFGNISGKPASYMFYVTFNGCSGLTGEIPLGLFGNLTNSPQSNMFSYTFRFCSGLTGPSARMPDGTYLYDFFTGATSSHVQDMYLGATGLSDYDSIPTAWK